MLRHKANLIKLLWLMTAAFLLSGCGDLQFQDLEDHIIKAKQTAALKVKKKIFPPTKLPVAITYQAGAQRAPFAIAQPVVSPEKVAANPLTAYPLNMLRFVGTMTQNNMTHAYVVTPDNMVYEVKVGDTLGDRYGKVVSILPDRINIAAQGTEGITPNMQQIETLQLKEEE